MTKAEEVGGPTVGPASVEAATAPSAAAIDHDIDIICAGITDELAAPFNRMVRKVSDDLYETLMYSVQEYLTDNVAHNLRNDLQSAKRQGLYDRQRAIAADAKAADLLSALKDARDCLLVATKAAITLPDFDHSEVLAIKRANAAIAKATAQ
jgi:hypothetical protein